MNDDCGAPRPLTRIQSAFLYAPLGGIIGAGVDTGWQLIARSIKGCRQPIDKTRVAMFSAGMAVVSAVIGYFSGARADSPVRSATTPIQPQTDAPQALRGSSYVESLRTADISDSRGR